MQESLLKGGNEEHAAGDRRTAARLYVQDKHNRGRDLARSAQGRLVQVVGQRRRLREGSDRQAEVAALSPQSRFDLPCKIVSASWSRPRFCLFSTNSTRNNAPPLKPRTGRSSSSRARAAAKPGSSPSVSPT